MHDPFVPTPWQASGEEIDLILGDVGQFLALGGLNQGASEFRCGTYVIMSHVTPNQLT